MASVLSITSYEHSAQVSSNVANLSLDQIHSNSQIQASDLSHILANNLQAVSSNLDVIANSPAVRTGNVSFAELLFDAALNATRSLTSAYFWLNQNGSLIFSANGTNNVYPAGRGPDLANRNYFTAARDSGMTFFSSATTSLTNSSVEYIFISRPVYSMQGTSASASPQVSNSKTTFNGVVAAAINLKTLGRSLKADVSPRLQGQVGLVDFKGTILYSSNESSIGESIYSQQIQSEIPADFRSQFYSFVNQSLNGQPGIEDLSYRGASGTIAYQPVFVNATTSSGEESLVQFGVLYVTATDILGASAGALIEQQQLVSVLIIVGIAGVSGGVVVAMLRWNKRLDDAVREKTSDLIATNETLEAKAKAEKDLMNITAHELRTPTQSILANAEILRQTIRPALGLPQNQAMIGNGAGIGNGGMVLAGDVQPSEVVELVDSTYRNAERLQKLTHNILEVARIDNRTLKLEREEFDLNELVGQVIADSQSRMMIPLEGDTPSESVRIVFEPKLIPPPFVNADRTKVDQVISNLLSNASKFTKEGGKITVSTRAENNYAVVSIKDEGVGIDQEILPKLFTKFATKSGTGLGLYIARSYVEAHGGTIQAQNDPEGGATFTFTIPLASPAAVLKEKQQQQQQQEQRALAPS